MKKLNKYITSSLAITGSVLSNAQIIYVDVDPDSSTISTNDNYFEVDIQINSSIGTLNTGFEMYLIDSMEYNSSVNSSYREIDFRAYDLDDHKLEILRNNNWYLNKFISGDTITGNTFPSSYFKSYVVGLGQNILQNGTISSNIGNSSSAFQLNDDAYFGFRIINTPDTLLGWVRIKTFANDSILDSVKVISYAYNTVSNEFIPVGIPQDPNPSLSISEVNKLDVKITYSNGEILVREIDESFNLKVITLNGKVLKNINNTKNIPLFNLPSGIYLVHITTEGEKQTTQKIYIN